jgi:hypothetical protein
MGSIAMGSSACASSSGGRVETAAAPSPPTGVGLRLPPAIGAFSLFSRRNFEDARAGSVFRYNGPDSLYADVFVYPGPDLAANCNAACATRVLQQEVTQFEHGDLPAMVSQNSIESFSVTLRETLPPPADSLWRLGAHVQLTLFRAGRAQRSEFYLYYLPRIRVKVRVTFTESDPRLQAVDEFVRELLPALAGPRT